MVGGKADYPYIPISIYTYMMSVTSVRVYIDTWERLKALKRPGQSYDEVIKKLLDNYEEVR